MENKVYGDPSKVKLDMEPLTDFGIGIDDQHPIVISLKNNSKVLDIMHFASDYQLYDIAAECLSEVIRHMIILKIKLNTTRYNHEILDSITKLNSKIFEQIFCIALDDDLISYSKSPRTQIKDLFNLISLNILNSQDTLLQESMSIDLKDIISFIEDIEIYLNDTE